MLFLSRCGGGASGSGPVNGGGGGGGNPAPDFTLSIGQSSLSVQQQGQYQAQSVSATALNGFTGTINLTLSGLPAGVTPIGTIPPFSPANSDTSSSFQLAASLNATIGTTNITVTGTSGTITHTTTFSLAVTEAAPFTFQVSPTTIALTPASGASVQITLLTNTDSSPQLSTSIDPSPFIPNTGVTVSSSGGLISTTNPVSFSIQAGASAPPLQNYPLVVTVSDNANNSRVVVVPLSVNVSSPSSTEPTRSTFVRTDQGPTGAVYDQTRKLLFVSVEVLNEVQVFSSVDGHQIASIPVFYPAGIDESADGSAVYVVGAFSPVVTTIDPNSLQVVTQTALPQGLTAIGIATLANGEAIVLPALNGRGFAPAYLWSTSGGTFTPIGQSVLYFNPAMTRSADRSKVLFYQGFSSGATAALYDVASAAFTGPVNLNGVEYMAISPDGSQIVGLGGQSPTLFCDENLNITQSMSLGLFPVFGVLYSLDGTRVYALGQDLYGMENLVAAIDPHSYKAVGIVPSPAFGTSPLFSGQWPVPYVIDETNMLFGAAGLGMAYLDVSSPGYLNLPLSSGALAQPTLASATTPTSITISGQWSSDWSYNASFGAPPASPQKKTATSVSVQGANSLVMTAPTGVAAGPTNVTLTRSDGWFQVLPDAVTYGPTVLKVDPNGGSSQGGDSIKITGFGLSGSNVQVLIGGKVASITNVLAANDNTPFPIEVLTVSTPAGSPGAADVVVQTPDGSTTVPGGFEYLLSAQIYPVAGVLQSVVYDHGRQRLYISNEQYNQVDIFDLSTNAYLPPISVGNQPTGLALTPDDALLAVVNYGDGTVSVIDPSKNQVVNTWQALTSSDNPSTSYALMIAPAIPHRALVSVYNTAVSQGGSVHVLNLDTGAISCSGSSWCANGTDVAGFAQTAMASTPDGTKVFLAEISGGDGASGLPIGLLDLNANALSTGFSGDFSDAAADADGTIFAGSLAVANSQLSNISIMPYEPYAGDVRSQDVLGEKLNVSGSLLYFPHVQDLFIFDVHSGRLVQHVALPETLPGSLNALALDQTGTRAFLISNSGLTIAQLPQLPLSLATASPAVGAGGTLVTLRGSGFLNGATVTFGAMQAAANFVDASTLTASVPSLSAGPVRITVRNPGGQTYTFDAAFTVQ